MNICKILINPVSLFKEIREQEKLWIPILIFTLSIILQAIVFYLQLGFGFRFILYQVISLLVIVEILLLHYLARLFKGKETLKIGVACFLSISAITVFFFPINIITLILNQTMWFNISDYIQTLWGIILAIIVIKKIYELNLFKSIVVAVIGFLLFTILGAGLFLVFRHQMIVEEKTNETMAQNIDAIKQNPNDFGAHMELGIAYAGQGHKEKAVEEFKKAIEIDPQRTEAHNFLGQIYYELGEIAKAKDEWEISLKLNPNDSLVKQKINLLE